MKRILTLLMTVSLLLCLAQPAANQQITPRSSRPSRQSHPSLPPRPNPPP